MDDRPLIESSSNPIAKRIRRLRSRKHRDRESVFFADGIHVVAQALEHGADVESLVVAPELLTSSFARDVVRGAAEGGTPVAHLATAVYEGLVQRENPAGMGALIRTHLTDLRSLDIERDAVVLAADEVGNPGNLGSIIRIADAAGAAGVVLAGAGTDPFHPGAVKASMGSLFSVPVCRVDGLDAAISWARDQEASVVTTSAHATLPYTDADYHLPALVVFGSEATGLSEEQRSQADIDVGIPMRGSVTSLNLAVAAGIVIFEVIRRGRPAPH